MSEQRRISKVVYHTDASDTTGTVWMDVTQKTVDATNLLSGETALKNDGTDIVGTLEPGGDYPVFTVNYNSQTENSTITCNKTFSECYTDATKETPVIIAILDFIVDGTLQFSKSLLLASISTGSQLTYMLNLNQVVPNYIIVYNSNGTITESGASDIFQDLTISGSGTYPVPGDIGFYAYHTVTVPSGTATTPATTVTANPTISVSSGGLITATASATKSVTPTVTAGYVNSGTAGTITVSGSKTQQLTTQAAKTVSPTESEQTAVASGVYTTGVVKVGAISSTYVGSGIAQKSSTDLTASGATVTAPAGFYASNASKSVASGSATTPATTVTANPTISVSSTGLITATASATKSVTPTVSAGYVSSGTAGTITVSGSNTQQLTTQAAKTVTPTTSSQTAVASGRYTTGAVTVAAIPSQYIVPSGTKSITENGTGIDVTQYATVDVDVASSGGGEEAEEKDVNFCDYDGRIVYSYTSSEFANLNALPENPTHSGLVAQGWSYSLSDAKTYVASYGKLWIGQFYITQSGCDEIDIDLKKGQETIVHRCQVSGTIIVDWGDNTETTTITGNSTTTILNNEHTYASSGKYTIKISRPSSNTIYRMLAGSSQTPGISIGDSTLSKNFPATWAVTAIRRAYGTIGNYGCYYFKNLRYITTTSSQTAGASFMSYGMAYCTKLRYALINSVSTYSFQGCSGLDRIAVKCEYYEFTKNNNYALYSSQIRSVTIPLPWTEGPIGQYFFSYSAIDEIVIPEKINEIQAGAFQYCYRLSTITFPSSLTHIRSNSFASCYGLKHIHFKSTTPPEVQSTGAFTDLPTDCIIYVPTGKLNDYKTATNYPNPATYTYIEE